MEFNEPLLSVSTVFLVLGAAKRWVWPLVEPHLKAGISARAKKWATVEHVAEGPTPDVFKPASVAPPAPASRLPVPSPRARPRAAPEPAPLPEEDVYAEEVTEVVGPRERTPPLADLRHEVELMRLRHAVTETQNDLREARRQLEGALEREKQLKSRVERQEAYNRQLVEEMAALRRGDKERSHGVERVGGRLAAAHIDRPFARVPELRRPEGNRPVRPPDEDESD